MSIHQRPDRPDRPVVVRWREEGRNRSRSFPDTKTGWRDARRLDALMAEAADQGAHAPRTPSRIPLDEWTTRWITVHGIGWQENTLLQRAEMVTAHIDPLLGGVRLRDLGRVRVQTYRRELVTAGRTPGTVNAAIAVLSACLTAAVEEGLIPANPCYRLRPLPTPPVNRRPIPLDAVEAIRDRMPTGRDRLIVALLAYAGLRPQEVRALTAGDVTPGALVVRAAVTRTGKQKRTKTGRTRVVPVRPELARDLHEGNGNGLLVPGGRGKPLDWHNWSSRVWRPVVRALGLDHVPYEGRHTLASLMIAEGRSIMEVQAVLGHASATTTLRHYSHLFELARRASDGPGGASPR